MTEQVVFVVALAFLALVVVGFGNWLGRMGSAPLVLPSPKPPRLCRQCGRQYPPRTMMESLLHRADDTERMQGKRNRTIGVFCPTPKPGDQERCASYFLRDHPKWWEEETA